jgi:hypothetical protein
MTDGNAAAGNVHHFGGYLWLLCPNLHKNWSPSAFSFRHRPVPGTQIDYEAVGKPPVPWPLNDTGSFLTECPKCGQRVGDLVTSIEGRMNEVAANPYITQRNYYLILNFSPQTGLGSGATAQ